MENEEQAAAHEDLLLGTRLGGYDIEHLLGKGAMGNVYRARQISLDRPVAIKLLIPYLALQPELLARFFREAKAAASINHPNLVQVYDFGEAEGTYYYVMELIDGHSLGEYLRRGEIFGESECLGIARQTMAALQAAHRSGIVHRDVKPDNLMLNRSGQVKLADLGLARVMDIEGDQSLTMTGMSLGTPFYISPEQVRGERQIDHRTDFYAMGATLFHLSCGRVPYAGETSAVVMARHLNDVVPRVRDVNPSLSESFSGLVQRMMAKAVDDRPLSHEEVFAELDHCEAELAAPRPARSPGSGERRVSGIRRLPGGWMRRLAAAVAVGVVCVAVAGGWLVWRRVSGARATGWTAFARTSAQRAVPVTFEAFSTAEMLGVREAFEGRVADAKKEGLELKVPFQPLEAKSQWLGERGGAEGGLRPGNGLWLSWDLGVVKNAFPNVPENAGPQWYRTILPQVWVQRGQLVLLFRGISAPGQIHLFFSPGAPALDQPKENLVDIVPVDPGRAQVVTLNITDQLKKMLSEEIGGGWIVRYEGAGTAVLADFAGGEKLLGPRIEVCTMGAQGRERGLGLLPFFRKQQNPPRGGREEGGQAPSSGAPHRDRDGAKARPPKP